MGTNKSSGTAKTAVTLGGVALGLSVLNGGLGNVLGGGNVRNDRFIEAEYETKEAARLREEVATLRGEKYSDSVALETYKFIAGELKERDLVIASNAVTSARNEERFNCLSNTVADMKGIQERHTTQLCHIGTQEAVTAERLQALAMANKEQGRSFYAALESANERILCYVNGNFVQNEKVIPVTRLSQKVVTASDVNNYYAAGNDDPTPQATSGTCCTYPTS